MGKRRISREAALGVLGVGRDAPPEDVRRAYHRKALASHPDKGGSAAAFQQVKEAFEVAKRPAVAPTVAAARAATAAPAPAPAPASTTHATLGGQAGYARVFRCYVCGEAFPSKRRLQHHTRTEHAAPDAPAAPAKRLVNGRCNTCGWKTCQCETAPVWAAPPPPRRRRSAPDRPADKRQEWFMRVRDRYERRGGSMDDVSVPPCLSDDRRSANRVLQAQVLLLREMGFSKAHAEAYADAELQLHVILDVMCDDGVEGEDPPPPGPVARAMSRLLRAVTWSRKQKKRDTQEESDDETWTPAPDFAFACGPELNREKWNAKRATSKNVPANGARIKKLIAAAPETWKKMPTPKTAPEQVAALVALGFSAADAEPYADAALSLDQILDHMCADGVVRV